MERYNIIRFYKTGRKRTMQTGLTLAEAQAHCSRDDTSCATWFEGFQKA